MRISYTALTSFNPSDVETPNLLTLLPLKARTRILRFRRTEDKNRSLIGWLSLERWKVSQGYKRSLEEYVEWGEGGKPLFTSRRTEDPQRTVGYNVAHDEDLVMFAVDVEASAETPVVMASLAASSGTKTALPGGPAVGVDCMRLDRDVRELKDLDEVLVTQLTDDELRRLSPPSTAARIDAALRRRAGHLLTLWTIKEAYTKLLGLGLGLDLKRVEVDFLRPLSEILSEGGGERGSLGGSERGERDGPCCICDGSIRISQDSQELVAPLHLVVGQLCTGPLDGSFPDEAGEQNQVYVWACFWRSMDGCRGWSMERVEGSELVVLGAEAGPKGS